MTDPNFNDVQDPDRRYELERERLRREMDELDELERKRRDRLKNYDDVSPLGNADEKPLDGFGRPSGGSSSTGEPAWDPTRPRPGDGSSTPPGDLPPFEYNNKPVIGDEAPDNEVIDRGANKPPMNVPLEEGSGSEAPGSETGAREFLGEEEASDDDQAARHRSFLTQRESRSSHFGVLSAKRLGRGAKSQPEDKPATQLSSGRKKTNAPLQWISLPAPTGRVRS